VVDNSEGRPDKESDLSLNKLSEVLSDPNTDPERKLRAAEALILGSRSLNQSVQFEVVALLADFIKKPVDMLTRKYSFLSSQDVEDVTQEVLYRLLSSRKLSQFDTSRGSFKSFLFIITKSEVFNYLRGPATRVFRTLYHDSPVLETLFKESRNDDETEPGKYDEVLEALRQIVETQLTDRERQVFNSISGVDDVISMQELAMNMDVTEAHFRVLKFRVLRKLRRLLVERFPWLGEFTTDGESE
jgi:RNA polymerase sigma factor (sigma-70 family)